MSVWDEVVGQDAVVADLVRAVEAAARQVGGAAVPGGGAGRPGGTGAGSTAMTHAWLFTGPPGSGRSTAARAFAAALQCPRGGCGACTVCRTVRAGTHPDVRVVRTEQLSIRVDDVRGLVLEASRHPAAGRWQVVLVEDADRLTEQAGNALLKAVEEPAERTVWLLCAPALEDVLPTIRSRCRHLGLRTPPLDAVAEVLQRRDGIDPAMAHFAARAAQGHIGRARRLATDENARLRRQEALHLPRKVAALDAALAAAAELVEGAADDAAAITGGLDERETADLGRSLGAGTVGRGMVAGAAGALKELEKQQKLRGKRLQRDALDRALVDLASVYRDALVVQLGADVGLVNEEARRDVLELARGTGPETTLRRIEAVMACRTALEGNVAPLLAVEAMVLALRADPDGE
ncbi:DNA polymerase III subunit delta' [Vallicoccus soli]|uniref:DNA polymerase III subunit delta' n=1 Tax=Vallicoccus soli TaxID=2339232 RepID=A0A3A3Z9E2_9ACTN|nr:DNA polymerase III subunit delta' [Vallicoccus soli]RJK97696.1 DNA polymerase III subunit delta' [Vallicoccus soli]